MFFIVGAVVCFSLLLLVVVIPSLYIDADIGQSESDMGHVGTPVGFQTGHLSSWTKQRLYLLFVIPAAAGVNAIWIFLAYHRHVRNAFYRLELHELQHMSLIQAARPVYALIQRAEAAATAAASTTTTGSRDATASIASSHTDSSSLRQQQPSLSLSNSLSGSFVLATSLPPTSSTFGGGGGASVGEGWDAHRRRADVSKEACPVPHLTDVRHLVDLVDRLVDEGVACRRRAAAVLLERFETLRPDIERQANETASPTLLSPRSKQLLGLLHPDSLAAEVEILSHFSAPPRNDEQVTNPYLSQRAGSPTIAPPPPGHRALSPEANKPSAIGVPQQSRTRIRRANSRVVFSRIPKKHPDVTPTKTTISVLSSSHAYMAPMNHPPRARSNAPDE